MARKAGSAGHHHQPTKLSLNVSHVANIACWGFDVDIFTYLAHHYAFECDDEPAGAAAVATDPLLMNPLTGAAAATGGGPAADFVGEYDDEAELQLNEHASEISSGGGQRQMYGRRRPRRQRITHAYELCAYNAKVAAHCGLFQTTKVWQVLHFLLRQLYQLATASAAAAAATAAAQSDRNGSDDDLASDIPGTTGFVSKVASLDSSLTPIREASERMGAPSRRRGSDRKEHDGGCDGAGAAVLGMGGALLQELGRANPDAANEMDLAPYPDVVDGSGSPGDNTRNRKQRKKEKKERERKQQKQQRLLREEEEQRLQWEEESIPGGGGRSSSSSSSSSSRISRERDRMEEQLGWLRQVAAVHMIVLQK
jgi:hypothetical protein